MIKTVLKTVLSGEDVEVSMALEGPGLHNTLFATSVPVKGIIITRDDSIIAQECVGINGDTFWVDEFIDYRKETKDD